MQTSAKSEKFNKVEHFILDCADCGFGGRRTHEGQREVDGIGHTSAKRERFVVGSGKSRKKLFNFMLIFMFSVHIISYELRCWGSGKHIKRAWTMNECALEPPKNKNEKNVNFQFSHITRRRLNSCHRVMRSHCVTLEWASKIRVNWIGQFHRFISHYSILRHVCCFCVG